MADKPRPEAQTTYEQYREEFLALITLAPQDDEDKRFNTLRDNIEKILAIYTNTPSPLESELFLNPYPSLRGYAGLIGLGDASIRNWKIFFQDWKKIRQEEANNLPAFYKKYENHAFKELRGRVYTEVFAAQINRFKEKFKKEKTVPITEKEYADCLEEYKKIKDSPVWGTIKPEDKTKLKEIRTIYKEASNIELENAQKTYNDLYERFLGFFKSGKEVVHKDITTYWKTVKEAHDKYTNQAMITAFPNASKVFTETKFRKLQDKQQPPASFFGKMVSNTLKKLADLAKENSFTWTPSELLKQYGNEPYIELRKHILESTILDFEKYFKGDSTSAKTKECQEAYKLIKAEVKKIGKDTLSQDARAKYGGLKIILKENQASCTKQSQAEIQTAKETQARLLKTFSSFFEKDKVITKKELEDYKNEVKTNLAKYEKDYPDAFLVLNDIKKYELQKGIFTSSKVEVPSSFDSLLKEIIDPLIEEATLDKPITMTEERLASYRNSDYPLLNEQIVKTVSLSSLQAEIEKAKDKFKAEGAVTYQQMKACRTNNTHLLGYLKPEEKTALQNNDPVAFKKIFDEINTIWTNYEKAYQASSKAATDKAQKAFDPLYRKFTNLLTLKPLKDSKAISDLVAEIDKTMQEVIDPDYPNTARVFMLWKDLKGIAGALKLGETATGLAKQVEQGAGAVNEGMLSAFENSLESKLNFLDTVASQAGLPGSEVFIDQAKNLFGQAFQQVFDQVNTCVEDLSGKSIDYIIGRDDSFNIVAKKVLEGWQATILNAPKPGDNVEDKIKYYKHLCAYYDKDVPWLQVQTHLQYVIQKAMISDVTKDEAAWKDALTKIPDAERKDTYAVWIRSCVEHPKRVTKANVAHEASLAKKGPGLDSEKEAPEAPKPPPVEPPKIETPKSPKTTPKTAETPPEQPKPKPEVPVAPAPATAPAAPPPTSHGIDTAVNTALENYKHWFTTHNSPKFFAKKMDDAKVGRKDSYGTLSWTRHHKSGQEKAADLLRRITGLDKNSAIEKVNAFLIDSKTRYHLHSFASFLLDELKKVDASPWKDVKLSKSKHYDKANVEGIVKGMRT